MKSVRHKEMIEMTVYFTPEQHTWLTAKAYTSGMSRNQIIRDMIDLTMRVVSKNFLNQEYGKFSSKII